MKTATLTDILTEMKRWLGPTDEEGAHIEGDRLLCHLVRHLAQGRDDQPLVEQILQAWKNIDKWYA